MSEHLVVFGATGRVGAGAVEQALAAGHRVTAAVRRPDAVTQRHERLTVVAADTTEPATVRAALAAARPASAAEVAAFLVREATSPRYHRELVGIWH